MIRNYLTKWTAYLPVLAVAALILTWGRDLPPPVVVLVALLLGGAVMAAVHHAEVVAHKVGEPYGSLVLAVAVTVIEVALIVTLMISGGEKTQSLARDTVFAAFMITCNGLVGLSLLVGAVRRHVAVFNSEGSGGAFATVATIATLSLVLPSFTTSRPGPQFSPAQLGFAAVASLALYFLFVMVQTRRHRDYFLPITTAGEVIDTEEHVDPPTWRAALTSLGLLLVALIGVVGLAKGVSPAIESAVTGAGLPQAVVGVVIALLVLLPETIAAVRAAARDRIQTSLNLALGSAMASIGLTIPTIAIAMISPRTAAARPGWHPDGVARADRGGRHAHDRPRTREHPAERRPSVAAGGVLVPGGEPLTAAYAGCRCRGAAVPQRSGGVRRCRLPTFMSVLFRAVSP
jgi:Ca2+:H+ antiporter